MKLLITIIQDQDVPTLLENLVENNVRATKLASTGGFLREGNTTLLIGVEEQQIESVLNLIRQTCKKREQLDTATILALDRIIDPPIGKIVVGGAIVFCVDVERFEKI